MTVSRKRADVYKRNEFIRDAYSKGWTVTKIAQKTGLTYKSVKVIASNLGCVRRDQDFIDHRRGFSVPAEKAADYALLQRKGISAAEAARILGIEVSR